MLVYIPLFTNKEQVAKEVSQIMHGFSKGIVEGFFRRTLENIQQLDINFKDFLSQKFY